MLKNLIKDRREKLDNLRKAGAGGYPAKTRRTRRIGELLANFDQLAGKKTPVYAAGRIIGWRTQGGIAFADVLDESGKIQIVLSKSKLRQFAVFQDNLDIGDFIECGGILLKTKRGEKSIEARRLKLLAKDLRPLPGQWSGLEDIELKLRRRYLDILIHPEVKDMFVKKSLFWQTVRRFLEEEGFMEVETPILEALPGGADAEPFITRHNALNADFYLRISPELALKKLLVGGFEKIFEIGRVFRNEGIDAEHLQDYSHCEFYWAYNDYENLMGLAETLYKRVVKAVTGGLKTSWRGQTVDWGKKWPKLDYYPLFKKYVGLDVERATEKQLLAKIKKEKIEFTKGAGRGRLIDLLFKKMARPHLIQPAFLINPPAEIEPLAKRLESDPRRVARTQVVACGTELGKGFSEANDPLDQRARLEEQARLRERGDKEAQRLDEEFLTALEYGMPPAAGFGFSERLFAVLMDRPVRETVIFPLMRPKKANKLKS